MTTIAGTALSLNYVDAVGTAARFNAPRSIAITSTGTIYVGDWYNDSVRKITPAVAGTVPGPITLPTVATNAATSVTASGAKLNGTVSSNGAATAVTFQYSTNAALSSGVTTTSPAQNLADEASGQAVSKAITGLAAHTQYYFRASGVNAGGATDGSILNFTTSNTNPTAPNGSATGTTGDQQAVTVTFPATDADEDTVAITSATPISTAIIAANGQPSAASVRVPRWIVNASAGTFVPQVKNAANRRVNGTGVYLPKSNSAWGYFPGTTVGGRIELTVP